MDGGIEVRGEARVGSADVVNGATDGAGDVDAGPFAVGRRGAVPTTATDGTRELVDEGVALEPCAVAGGEVVSRRGIIELAVERL